MYWSRFKLYEDIREWKCCFVRLQDVDKEADGPRPSLVQAERAVGLPRAARELLREQEVRAAVRAAEVGGVAGESVQQQEDVTGARHAVADARPLPQQPALPAQLPHLPAAGAVSRVSFYTGTGNEVPRLVTNLTDFFEENKEFSMILGKIWNFNVVSD